MIIKIESGDIGDELDQVGGMLILKQVTFSRFVLTVIAVFVVLFLCACADAKGNKVPHGDYKFFVEGTLRWKNYVLYSGIITLGDKPVTVQADVEFKYETSDRQAALTSDSPENSMISNVIASFLPNLSSYPTIMSFILLSPRRIRRCDT